jgi:Ni,Fe-hydrogenase I cytochrome b subunit
MLAFFLAIVYFVPDGFNVIDALIRSFMFAFGIALIMLVLTMVPIFLTLQKNRCNNREIIHGKEPDLVGPLREKEAEMQS